MSAREQQHWPTLKRDLLAPLLHAPASPRSEAVAVEIMDALVAAGLHRSVPLPDVMLASIAVVEDLTVLHAEAIDQPAVDIPWPLTPTDVQRRHQQWRRAARALDRDRLERLRNMTAEQAHKAAEDLLGFVNELPPKAGRSGLVTQQRLFRRVER